ncbi:MAG: thioredoxin-disulfide reductase [Syntrophobacterales bacterium]|nr:thioredoxin-disulfide reductase [Syntrophobacterales bacterium]
MADIRIPENVYDVIIIGGGPGGLTAGLYASRAGQKVMLLEGSSTVSQITVTDLIENYPGIPEIGGSELIDRFKSQAVGFGLKVKPEQVNEITSEYLGDVEGWKLRSDNEEYHALSVIVATGAHWRYLDVPGEKDFLGRGVSFCATCDAPFYRNREVAVVGGGNTAIQEALYLTKFARKVTVIHRRNRLRATGILQERAFANDKIDFAWDSAVEKILGDSGVTGVRIKNVEKPDETREIPVDGIFLFIGLTPDTKLVEGIVNLDKDGYIIAHGDMRTSAKGIFACGDCIHKSLRQVVTACGDGATAANSAELYVDEIKGQAY